MSIYQKLASRIHAGESEIIPRLFEMLADETDARILLGLPAGIEELSDKFGISVKEAGDRIHELYLRGVVFPNKWASPTTYRMAKDVLHLHDTTVQWKKAPEEFRDLWQEWVETEFVTFSKMFHEMRKDKKPLSRIIPANVWIEPKSTVLPFDSLREIVENAKSLAVLPCTCRIKAKKCDNTLEACIVLNKSADYNIDRGTGRKIDAKEAMEIFKKCEEEGLVHLTGANSQNDPGPLLCNCCPCCCMALPLMIQGYAVNDPSRFCAKIDEDACNGCEICIDVCHFSAIGFQNEASGTVAVDAEKCMGCGICVSKCPEDAIEMIEARPPEFVPVESESIY